MRDDLRRRRRRIDRFDRGVFFVFFFVFFFASRDLDPTDAAEGRRHRGVGHWKRSQDAASSSWTPAQVSIAVFPTLPTVSP